MLTVYILLQLPPSVQNGGEYSYNQQSMAVLGEGSAQYRFPEIKVEEFKTIAEDLELRWKGQERNSPVQAMRYEFNMLYMYGRYCIHIYMYMYIRISVVYYSV